MAKTQTVDGGVGQGPAGGIGFGGSFAPPITDAQIAAYTKLAQADECPPEVRDGMETLLTMVKTFQETGRSKLRGTPHPSGRGMVVKLEPAEMQRIERVVPWKHELDALAKVFEEKIGDKARRDAAFHLLWYGYELSVHDREPITTDTL